MQLTCKKCKICWNSWCSFTQNLENFGSKHKICSWPCIFSINSGHSLYCNLQNVWLLQKWEFVACTRYQPCYILENTPM